MKIRNGFVSNSSSSSFIIHRSAFKKPGDLENLFQDLLKIRNEQEKIVGRVFWGDSDETFYREGNNFIVVETNHCPDEVWKLFEKYKIDEDNTFYM